MRIAIDVSNAVKRPPTGISNSIHGVVNGLSMLEDPVRFDLCLRLSKLKYYRPGRFPRDKRFKLKIIQPPFNFIYPKRIDLFHGPDARVPDFKGCAITATFHDVFSLLEYDFMDTRFREMKKARYEAICERAHMVFTCSQNTKDDIIKYLGLPSERIMVTPYGVSVLFEPQSKDAKDEVKRQFNIEGKYLLFVGQIARRKNVANILRAFMGIKKEAPYPIKLVLVGKPSYGAQEALDLMKEPAIGNDLIRIPNCPLRDLVRLYAGAEVFLFPSLYEGFGLPVLEAMACGTCVVTSNVSSLPEVAGDGAIQIDPNDVDGLTNCVLSLLHNESLAIEYQEKGLKRVKEFTWEQTARKTMEGFKKAMALFK